MNATFTKGCYVYEDSEGDMRFMTLAMDGESCVSSTYTTMDCSGTPSSTGNMYNDEDCSAQNESQWTPEGSSERFHCAQTIPEFAKDLTCLTSTDIYRVSK